MATKTHISKHFPTQTHMIAAERHEIAVGEDEASDRNLGVENRGRFRDQ